MPKNTSGYKPQRDYNPEPRRGGSKPGSRSPGHRGYTESAPATKKARWNADERAERAAGRSTETTGRGDRSSDSRGSGATSWDRGNRAPRTDYAGPRPTRDGRPARDDDRAPRSFNRDDRAPRSTGRDDRAPRSTGRDDRAPRTFNRDDRAPRSTGRDDRAPRSTGRDDRAPRTFNRGEDRPARSFNRDDRAPRSTGRDDRAPRTFNRGEDRPARSFNRDDRAPRTFNRGDDRPARTFNRGEDRPARSFDRDDRAPRRQDDRGSRTFNRDDRAPRTFNRDDRAPRTFNRDERPARRDDDRPARGFDRGDRAPRSFDRDERPARRFDRQDRAPQRSPRIGSNDDVVLERLEAKTIVAADVEGVTFESLGLGDNIVRALAALGAESPFPIQAATIPDVIKHRDVLGRGRTGSGKTIAFGAPLVERLMENNGGKGREMGRAPRALILAPTRELALQIDRTVQPIARSVGLFTTQVYGGVPQARQVGALRRGVDIIIGTPGRVGDLVRQGHLDLSKTIISVLDEADHMCELGFLEPVQDILRETKQGGQRLMFSATLDRGVADLAREFLKDPAVHEVAGEDQDSGTIDHRVLVVDREDKVAVITQLADRDGKVIIFTRTRNYADELADMLDHAGLSTVSLHGDLNQARRTKNLEKLTSGRAQILVATDVAARGIHIDDIELIIQADAPDEYKVYMHRAGRTGRAGKEGTVVTLIPRNRRRRMEELLHRAEIKADFNDFKPGNKF